MLKNKKFLLSLLIISFLFCSRKKLPIEPGTLGNEEIKEKELPRILRVYTLYDFDRKIEDYDTATADIQDEIIIEFSEPMNENSVLSSVSIEVVGGKSTSVPAGTWVLENNNKILRYKLNQGEGFVDSTKYEVIITTGAEDISGNPLDGNGNGFPDGVADNFHITLWTDKGNTISDPDYEPPHFILSNLISPNPILLGGGIGTQDSIHVRFNTIDIDQSTVSQAFKLVNYESGAEISLGSPTIIVDTLLNRTDIIFKNFTLEYKTVYKLTIYTSLSDTAGNTLDGNNNGYSERDDIDRVEILFATVKNANGDFTEFPRFDDYIRNGNIITFWFSKFMDTTTLTQDNIKIFRSYLSDQLPFVMKIYDNHQNKKTYVEITLLSNKKEPVYLWINKDVKDFEGLKLDGSGDNIGGIEGEDNEIIYIPAP